MRLNDLILEQELINELTILVGDDVINESIKSDIKSLVSKIKGIKSSLTDINVIDTKEDLINFSKKVGSIIGKPALLPAEKAWEAHTAVQRAGGTGIAADMVTVAGGGLSIAAAMAAASGLMKILGLTLIPSMGLGLLVMMAVFFGYNTIATKIFDSISKKQATTEK
jgi:hypothetical protein